jgi:hypothetical protein
MRFCFAVSSSCDSVVILPSCDFVYIGCFNTLTIFCAKAASVSIRLLGFLVCCAHLSFAIRLKKCDHHLRPFDCRSQLRAVLERHL